jgi:hypothetical protein
LRENAAQSIRPHLPASTKNPDQALDISISPHSGFSSLDARICGEGSVTSEGSFLSRFTLKFLEVFAAGLATAVSGYMVAHFAGYWAVSTPTTVLKEPSAIQRQDQSRSQGAVVAEPTSAPPTSARSVANEAPATAEPQASATERQPLRETTESKPRAAAKDTTQSFEARVRAALAKAGPPTPAPSDAPRRQAVAPIDAAPRPVDLPTGSIAGAPPSESTPRSGPVEPPSIAVAPTVENSAAPPTAPIQLAPPATVEIKSQPIAGVDANQPVQAAAEPPPRTDQDGPFAAITKRLHLDKLLPGDGPPRPPMPVGQ